MKKYCVKIENEYGQIIFQKDFRLKRSAQKWSCKMVEAILTTDNQAIITSALTGEVINFISR